MSCGTTRWLHLIDRLFVDGKIASWRFRSQWDLPAERKPRGIAVGSYAAGMAVPIALGLSLKPDVPQVIRAIIALAETSG